MKNKEWVLNRIDEMVKVPEMFASTRESFIVQIWTMLEMLEIDNNIIRDVLADKLNFSSNEDDYVNREFAEDIAFIANVILKDI